MTERMDRIYQKDKEENKEFDDAVKGGTLDNLREGVKIRQKENQPSQMDAYLQSLPPGVRKDEMSNTGESWATYGATLLGTTAAIKYPMAALTVLGAPTNVQELQLDLLSAKSGQLPNRLRARAIGRITGVVDEVFDPVRKWTRDKFGNKQLVFGPGAMKRDQLKRFTWNDLNSRTLNRHFNMKGDSRLFNKVNTHLSAMDDFRLMNTDKRFPMSGFSKYYGKKPTVIIDGKTWGIGWSRKKNNYELFDPKSRIQSRIRRLSKDLTSNASEENKRQIIYAIKRDLNKQSQNLTPDQWDILIQNPGGVYVEHLIAIDSPFWKTKRAYYQPGDARNLKIIGDQNFKVLKDNIEKHIHATYGDMYYIDYDHLTQNLILRNTASGKTLPTQIPGYGKATDWRIYLQDTFAGNPMRTLEEVDPPIPSNISRQIEGTESEGWYFNK